MMRVAYSVMMGWICDQTDFFLLFPSLPFRSVSRVRFFRMWCMGSLGLLVGLVCGSGWVFL